MRTPTAAYYWHEQGLTPRWLSGMHGAAAVMLGILLVIQPSASPTVVAGSLGAYWLATGVLGFVAVMMDRTAWGVKVASATLGVMGGLWVIRSPLWFDAISPERSLWIAGLLSIAIGSLGLIASPADDGNAFRLMGALNVLIGITLAFNPIGTLMMLPVAVGTLALLAGTAVLVLTWRSRRSAPKVQPHDPPERHRPPPRDSASAQGLGSSTRHRFGAKNDGTQQCVADKSLPADASLLAGRYRLEQCMHVDRVWEVWLCTDTHTGSPVTIRLTTQRHSGDGYVLRCNEAQLAASRAFLDPRVMPVIDSGTDECGDYLVSEAPPGHSLEEILSCGPIPTESLTHMAMELCRLLTRARHAGIIHGPLVPRTVFINEDGCVHVNEFFVGDRAAPLPIEARPFSAPEQHTVVVGTPAEEVYNVGALLRASGGAMINAQEGTGILGRGGALPGSRREAQAGIRAIWRRAITDRPSLRYRNLADMMDDLRVLDERQSARSRVQPAAGVLAMGIALALLAASFSTAYVTIPSVIGMDSARAASELRRAGLTPQAGRGGQSNAGHVEVVAAQVPRAGTVVAPRTTVRVTGYVRR